MLALAAACAASPELVELSEWRAPALQPCETREPEGDIHALVDSAALAHRIAGLGLADGSLLLSVLVDSAAVQRLHRIETSLPPADAEQLEDLMTGAMEDGPGGPAHGRFLARVRDGGLVDLRLAAYQGCRPRLTNARVLRWRLDQVGQRIRKEGTAEIWMFVDTAGRVEKAMVEESAGEALDTAFVRVARTARFQPALIDRRPLSVWVAMKFALADSTEWPRPDRQP
ncbi:MAG: energy transducer TonB [Candidatus Longimicrobiales bacterium M2_2A_002]